MDVRYDGCCRRRRDRSVSDSLRLVLSDRAYLQAWLPLPILVIGIAVASPYMPLDMILSQGGWPWGRSQQKLAMVAANFVLNLALVPLLGADGSAFVTALVTTLGAAILRFIAFSAAFGYAFTIREEGRPQGSNEGGSTRPANAGPRYSAVLRCAVGAHISSMFLGLGSTREHPAVDKSRRLQISRRPVAHIRVVSGR
jgi:hypothetical protein